MEIESQLKAAFRTTVIISATLVASLLVYAVMVEVIKAQMNPFPGFLVPGRGAQNLRYLCYAVSIAAVVLMRLAGKSGLKTVPGEDVRQLIYRLSRATVLTFSLGELPAVFGFVLFLLTGSSKDFYILLFVSLCLQFIYFPRFKVWQTFVRERFPGQGV